MIRTVSALAAVIVIPLVAACSSTDTATVATSASATPTPAVPRCTTATGLEISLGQGAGAAVPIVFTNRGSRMCRIAGYPGVSYVAGDDRHRVGDPAGGDPGPLPEMTLQQGQSASAELKQADVNKIDPSLCGPTPAWGLRVNPPYSGTDAVYFAKPGATACAKHMADDRVWQFHLTVTPVHGTR